MKALSPIERMIDQATGFDDKIGAPIKRPPNPPEGSTEAILEILKAAERWFDQRRPKGWTIEQHLQTPDIYRADKNIRLTQAERRLARAVAKMKRLGL